MAGSDGRHATINRMADGEPIGAAVFLTADELRSLGVDPETTDQILVTVTDGSLCVTPATPRETDSAPRADASS